MHSPPPTNPALPGTNSHRILSLGTTGRGEISAYPTTNRRRVPLVRSLWQRLHSSECIPHHQPAPCSASAPATSTPSRAIFLANASAGVSPESMSRTHGTSSCCTTPPAFRPRRGGRRRGTAPTDAPLPARRAEDSASNDGRCRFSSRRNLSSLLLVCGWLTRASMCLIPIPASPPPQTPSRRASCTPARSRRTGRRGS